LRLWSWLHSIDELSFSRDNLAVKLNNSKVRIKVFRENKILWFNFYLVFLYFDHADYSDNDLIELCIELDVFLKLDSSNYREIQLKKTEDLLYFRIFLLHKIITSVISFLRLSFCVSASPLVKIDRSVFLPLVRSDN